MIRGRRPPSNAPVRSPVVPLENCEAPRNQPEGRHPCGGERLYDESMECDVSAKGRCGEACSRVLRHSGQHGSRPHQSRKGKNSRLWILYGPYAGIRHNSQLLIAA